MSRKRQFRVIFSITILVIFIISTMLVMLSPENKDPRCKGSALCYSDTVKEIIDGDTLDVGDRRIRLALVNSPELNQVGYNEAKQFTATLCPVGSQALVDEDDGQTEGSYGRTVAVVYCGDKNLNAELLTAGHAVILQEFCSVSEFASESWASECQ